MAQHQVNTAGLDVHSLSEASMNAVAVSRRRVENTICSFLAALLLRRRIGTFYLLALVIPGCSLGMPSINSRQHYVIIQPCLISQRKNSYFTTQIPTSRPPFVRWGIWRFSPKPFWIWKHIHVHKVRL